MHVPQAPSSKPHSFITHQQACTELRIMSLVPCPSLLCSVMPWILFCVASDPLPGPAADSSAEAP